MRTRYLLVALLAIPLVDAAFLVWVAGEIGAVSTIALVVLTGLVGMLLVRAEGRHAIHGLERKLARGQPPTSELLDGALLVAAGAFLLTPGLVTDTVGFLLAIPPTRYPIREAIKRYVVVPYIDRRTDGLASGVAWTGGFPGPDGGPGAAGSGGPGAGGSGGSSTTAGGANAESGAGSAGSGGQGDDVVDVNYSVDDNESQDRRT
ncbi:FxsA family protein [Candidatus Halobonum tyrrellensis]|uniref:Exclusion suppressor FxsA n=1 Tax=Candidatus Halobonum tyrrellensis G22 TaxID=1324957 RepID=V4HE66_9EURY|nr:FxsA family protein [Candidatus Halobonum tyrrellensis]ESP88338.1 exclusion suppressor FxsA [Candidatus Halobonum tyrrellensis G22]